MAIGGKSIDGLQPTQHAATAAAIALRSRLDPIPRLLKLATRADRSAAENVHQLRVATRRAGAALDAFADLLEPDTLARVRKRLTRLRRAAAGVREADVALAALSKRRRKSDDPERAALDHLIAQARRERQRARRKLRSAADRYPSSKLRRAHARLVRPLDAEDQRQQRGPTLLDIADATIDAYLGAISHAASGDLRELENVHELRIEVKRLRYGLELFDPCLERAGADDVYERLAALQDRLGDLNDACELLDRLESANDGDLDGTLQAGLERLIAACRAELADAHAGFLADWSHGEVAALAERLRILTIHETAAHDAAAQQAAPPETADHDPRRDSGNRVHLPPRRPDPAAPLDLPADPPAELPNDAPHRLAAIDVGTNSIRLIIAEAVGSNDGGDGAYRILDDEKDIARLGRGLDATGLMDPTAMERAALVVGRMKGIARGYGVGDVRVVGTAVVREARNGGELVHLIKQHAGLELEVVSAEDEAKLAFLSASHAFDLTAAPAAVIDIGGGSTEVVVSAGGVIDRVYTIPLGAVRLTERFGGPVAAAGERYEEMVTEVRKAFRDHIGRPPFVPQVLIGTGGTFTALGNMARHAELGPAVDGLFAGSVQGYEVRRWELRHLLEHLRSLSPRDRERMGGLSPDRADIIVAGLALADGLMKRLEANRVLVHEGGIRDGILLQMVARRDGGGPSRSAGGGGRDPMRSILRFARQCGYEHRHCDHVARVATQIFDRLAALPGTADPDLFTPRNRLLLEAAAIVHDVGYLINYARHHKHSYHLIVHADLPGLTGREVEIIANLARYHRRGEPSSEHRTYAKLSRDDRAIVAGLAAILRIADGLDRTHMQRARSVRVLVDDGEARFLVESADEPEVDLWGAARKGGLFERHFGLRARFEWAGPPAQPDLAQPDPAQLDPAQLDPAQLDPAQLDPAQLGHPRPSLPPELASLRPHQ